MNFLVLFLISKVVINEVFIGGEKWVELYNLSGFDVDLNGWKILLSNDSFKLSGQIKGYGYKVLTERDFPILSSLNSVSGMLILVNSSGDVEDFVNWGEPDKSWKNYKDYLWNPGAVCSSKGLARIPNGRDFDIRTDWKKLYKPSPGSANPVTSNLDVQSWGKIKALFSPKNYPHK